jgi:hypothetical protein
MKTKTKLRAGSLTTNHNPSKGLKIKTRVRAGSLTTNHNAVRP